MTAIISLVFLHNHVDAQMAIGILCKQGYEWIRSGINCPSLVRSFPDRRMFHSFGFLFESGAKAETIIWVGENQIKQTNKQTKEILTKVKTLLTCVNSHQQTEFGDFSPRAKLWWMSNMWICLLFLSVFPSPYSFSSLPLSYLPLYYADSRVDQFVLILKAGASPKSCFYISKPGLGPNDSDTICGHWHYFFFFPPHLQIHMCHLWNCIYHQIVSIHFKGQISFKSSTPSYYCWLETSDVSKVEWGRI